MKLKIKRNNNYQEDDYFEDNKEDTTKSVGLFGLFINALNEIKKENEMRNKEYEKERYRRAIIEQNLYKGKNYDDMYDGLN